MPTIHNSHREGVEALEDHIIALVMTHLSTPEHFESGFTVVDVMKVFLVTPPDNTVICPGCGPAFQAKWEASCFATAIAAFLDATFERSLCCDPPPESAA